MASSGVGVGARRGVARRAPPHGSGAEDDDEEAASTVAPEMNTFKLGLRPLDDPDNFKPSVQLVASEYATRYLESIGVRPSKVALDMVHKNVPLSESNIKATLRAKGHVADEVHVSIPSVVHQFRPPTVINTASVLQLGIGNAVMAAHAHAHAHAAAATGEQQGGDSEAGPGPGSQKQQQQQQSELASKSRSRHGSDFVSMAAPFLHPFNMDMTLARKSVAALLAVDAKQRSSQSSARDGYAANTNSTRLGHDRHSYSAVPGHGGGGSSDPRALARKETVTLSPHRAAAAEATGAAPHGAGGVQLPQMPVASPRREVLRAEVQEELMQEVVVTPEVVLTLQAQLKNSLTSWYKSQAPEALKGRLSQGEFHSTLELLSADHTIKFFITLINFLHEEFVWGAHTAHVEAARPQASDSHRIISPARDSMTSGQWSHRSSSTHGGLGLGPGLAPPQPHASSQLMTALQKHDLGYKEFMKGKLEEIERSRQQQASPSLPGGGGGGSGGSSRHQQAAAHGYRPTAESMNTHNAGALDGPYGGALSKERASGRAAGASQLFGGLNLPMAAASRGRAMAHDPYGSSAPPTGPVGGGAEVGREPFAPRPKPYMDDDVETAVDMPKHVRRALHRSTSMALAAAASTARTIHSGITPADLAALQSMRLYALHAEFAGRFKALRQSRSGLFFTLPLLLLAMRLCIHTLFTTLYPLWTKMREGVAVLERMDQALVELFDPHGYLQRNLSMVQSTPSAIEVVTRYPQRHGRERRHFSDMSALLQTTMCDAQSAGARKLLQRSATGASSVLHTTLTEAQRAQLFRCGLHIMATLDPNLAQLGEPQETNRASFLEPSY